jgi:PAS domain S-box-containing protein
VVAIVVGLFALRPGWFAGPQSRAYDVLARWAGGGALSEHVAVVEIDERSLAEYGRWPWPRDTLGRLVKSAGTAGAQVVALDVILSEQDRGNNDEVLAEAIRSVPTVIGYSMRFDRLPATAGSCGLPVLPLVVLQPSGDADGAFFHAMGVECTVPAIAKAAAGGGFLNASPDRDGKLRMLPLIIEQGGQYYPSLALAAMDVYGRVSRMQLRENALGAEWLRLDDRLVPVEGRSDLRLRYRGPRRTLPYVSAADLMAGRAAGALKGKIAVVGASAAGLESTVATPWDALFPPVEVHATALDNLLRVDPLRRPADGYLWELVLAVLLGGTSVMALALIRSLWGGAITLVLAAVAWIAGGQAAKAGLMLSPVPATAAVACNFVAMTMLNYRTERRRAESAEERTEEVRQESESRYQQLVENVNDAIITTDAQARLLFANRRFREWFGLRDREIRGLALEEYVAPEWRDAVREQHRRLMTGESEAGQVQYEGVRADGSRIWIEALVSSVKEGTQVTGMQCALRDITERRRLEAQYLQSQKMESVGRLAGGVAHDFNNLLTVINGYSELMGAKVSNDAELQDMVRQIHRAGLRAAELTAQLLTFSRKQSVQPRPIELNAVVEEAHRMLQRVVGEDIEIQMRLGNSTQVLADPGQMQQVLMNLVVNARDSMTGGGKLTIETKSVEVAEAFARAHPEVPHGSYVCLSVTDTGTGMTDEVRRRIFEPFFTTKEKGKGTGLGLATVYGIVQQCGGYILVDSKVGAGSRFEIYLPRTAKAAQHGPETVAAAVARGSETVLLVEDQAAVRQLTEDMLRSQGYDVLAAASGSEGIARSKEHPGTIQLLITDVILPQMNGRALAEALRRERPEIKVLYMSGYSDEIVERQGGLEHGVAYLAKPYSVETLTAKVREVLGSATTGVGGMV